MQAVRPQRVAKHITFAIFLLAPWACVGDCPLATTRTASAQAEQTPAREEARALPTETSLMSPSECDREPRLERVDDRNLLDGELHGYVVGLPESPRERLPRPPWHTWKVKQVGPKKFESTKQRVRHKTPVRVVATQLHSDGSRLSSWQGALEVEEIEHPGTKYLIDIKDFSLVPFWRCGLDHLSEGQAVIATVTEKAHGVDRQGEWINLAKGDRVYCNTPLHLGEDREEVSCLVHRKWRYGYGGVNVKIPIDVLDVVY